MKNKQTSFCLMILLLGLTSIAQADNITFTSPEKSSDVVRFAVIADLTGGERDGVFDVAVEGLSALQPDFILSIGDLIEGGIEDIATLNNEWQYFSKRINKAGVPFYPVVGNHDISNLVQRQWWEKNIGPRYYHFRYKDILFLMLDSEDYPDARFGELQRIRDEGIAVYMKNPADFPNTEYEKLPERKYGQISEKQSRYFEDIIKNNTDVRWTFVLIHKPAWRAEGNKYFKGIETALAGRPYTVMNGHVHTYDYTQRLGHDYIQLGTTGGAFTPADSGEYMDHILWVTMKDNEPRYLNITLTGMRTKKGVVPYTGVRPCFAQEACAE